MICLTAFLRAILWICQITIRLIMEGKGTMENVNLYQEMNDKIAEDHPCMRREYLYFIWI